MSRYIPTLGLLACVSTLTLLTGCHPQQPFYFHGDGDMSHYKGMATEIEYPDVAVDRLGDVEGAHAPFSLTSDQPKETWELTLEEAVQIALNNSKVMRQLGGAAIIQSGGQGGGTPDYILRNPNLAPTMYDPALAETDARQGVEAALSAFDTQFASSLLWEKRDAPVNFDTNLYPFGLNVNRGDAGTFQAQLQKTAATGGTFAIRHNVKYELSNGRTRVYPSDWNTNVELEARQPLLQGAGVGFNRIAGPGATPGFNNGVMIARINTDIALGNFEAGVRNLVADVENTYWELYFTYRNLDAVLAGRDSALQTWRKIYALATVGSKGGEAEREAQAREQYFLFRSTAERSLNALYRAESNLRYMLGIAATDGRLIRPADEPTTGKVAFDWYAVHNEALVRSVELREQKWTIKRRELELIAAKNYLMPRLDAVARYRFLGLGDDLVSTDSARVPSAADPYPYSYNTMLDGNFQEWAVGLNFQMPLGFRKEMANVRHAQLQLARDRAVLQDQELELSHQLAAAIRDLDANFVLSQTIFNRRVAAQRQVEAVQAAYETDTVTIDVLLNAQRLLAQAESDYYRSIVDYNKNITLVHLRKGSLLEYNGVYLAEGPWPAKAYFDACRLARQRDAAHYIDYGFTKPRVVSQGPVAQAAGQGEMLPDQILDAPTPAVPGEKIEVVPAPKPATPNVQPQSRERMQPLPPLPTPTDPQARNGASGRATGRKAGPDLADLNLDLLSSTARPATSSEVKQSEVKQTSLQQPVGVQQSVKSAGGWTSPGANTPVRAASVTAPANTASASTGWRSAK